MIKVFSVIRDILHNKCNLQLDHIQPEARFEVELAIDSSEMLELIVELEQIFEIEISYDDIDSFIFNPNNTKMTVQNAIDYIENRIKENQYKSS